MKLDLSEIARSLGMHYTYEVEQDDRELREQGIVLDGLVYGSIQFSNTGQLLLARGTLSATVTLECARCLAQFPSAQELVVEEQFALHPERTAGKGSEEDIEEPAGDDPDTADALIYDEGILDLTEMIRQNILVTLPFAPLCREDCAGLCPHCGKDLNEGSCECAPDEGESTLSLGDLLSGLEGESHVPGATDSSAGESA